MSSHANRENNSLSFVKFIVIVFSALFLFTSCVTDREQEAASGAAAEAGAVCASAAAYESVTVSEPSPVIEPAVEHESDQYSLPDGFVYVTDVIPTVQLEIPYRRQFRREAV
ncbi:MAG: M15 family metallopeptidase [Clostridiaceae bacterium]|jgi:hypothetical protein|nr:M15 family metallopeptidase [Clostridiaceae bacterium]